VLLSVVFDRDDGVCWLCGGTPLLDPPAGAVTFGVTGVPRPVPHPELATLDHVVMLSEGGEHSYANVRLAHLVCNSWPLRETREFYLRRLQTGRRVWEDNAARRLHAVTQHGQARTPGMLPIALDPNGNRLGGSAQVRATVGGRRRPATD
jgi:HNH endonuclease